MITLNQAKSHLDGINKLARSENSFLSCVHSYLRTVEVDVLRYVRADQFQNHNDISELISKINQTEKIVDRFLRGDL